MLVWNIIIKYNIFNSNIYNFDKIGFFMGMLSYAKVIITSNHKNKPRTKQFSNCKWVSVIQIICVDGYVLFPYIIVKKKCHFFFGIEMVIYLTHNIYDSVKIIKPLMKLIWINLYILKHAQNFVRKMDINY